MPFLSDPFDDDKLREECGIFGVIGVQDADAGEVPMAFIVSANPPSLAEVQAFLDPEIAHYKQVRRLEVVEAIPKSASGKILRRVLRDQVKAQA